jgi:hypothetical protein
MPAGRRLAWGLVAMSPAAGGAILATREETTAVREALVEADPPRLDLLPLGQPLPPPPMTAYRRRP